MSVPRATVWARGPWAQPARPLGPFALVCLSDHDQSSPRTRRSPVHHARAHTETEAAKTLAPSSTSSSSRAADGDATLRLRSAPVAVDRGGMELEGDPRLVAVAARVVKVDGGKVVVAMDEDAAAGGGVGVGVVSDLLYATGSAAVGEGYGGECTDNMQELLDGGGAEERMLGVELGGFRGEARWTLMPVGDAAIETSEEMSDPVTLQYSETGLTGDDQRAKYRLPPLDGYGFRASGLVWSKLKGHPWWPGEIFDTSDASELALKHQKKKGSHLVAYFGSNTFAWCDESQLKPFMSNYSQMANQSNSDAFISSVNLALEEISRRILSGMCCFCLPEALSDNCMSYMVENSGLRDGVTCSKVTRSEILECFNAENFLSYLKSLALFPGQGGELLDLVIACSQLTSFFQSKGCHELASFGSGSELVDDGMDSSSTKNVLLPEAVTYEQKPSEGKPKRRRIKICVKKPQNDLELTEENPISSLNNECTFVDCMGLNIIGKVKGKRSEKRRKYVPSPEVHTTDHGQDDSWSGFCLNNDPTDTLGEASAKMRPRRKQRSSKETCAPSSDLSSHVPPLQLGLLGPKKQIQLIERSIIHADEQRIDEIMPSALVLSFGRSAALPSKLDLIRLFSRYGPLKENETEVHQNTNTVKVAFKRRFDAANAFSVVGKYSYFGPSLCSFRLVNLPFSLSKLSPEDPGTEVPACRESGVDIVHVGIISKVCLLDESVVSSGPPPPPPPPPPRGPRHLPSSPRARLALLRRFLRRWGWGENGGGVVAMSSTHVAVAAPDPGGDGGLGEARLVDADAAAAPAAGDAEGSLGGGGGGSSAPAAAGDADVTMTEAVEEEVEVEVAGDAEAEAAVVAGDAAGDPLYGTESAGMVVDEPVDAAEGGVDGGDGGKEGLEAEARVLQGEAATEPVPAGGDVAIASEVAAEAHDSATPEHAEAESNDLEENHVDRGKDNGVAVAHCDDEMQNNVEGSSEIQEDDGAPTIEQQDDESEMPLPSSVLNFELCARYSLPPLDKGEFRVSDLVWGKVKSHPWWPGEIFDPSDASELALKHQKKGSHLIAYFGDNTFAWCDESQLKPFVSNYSQMEKQSSSDAFVSSVNYALEELSRRILSGMSCSCLPEELSDNGMSYMVENAGLKDGVTCSAVNRSEILSCCSPENLLNYVKSLALFPGQGGDLLELVIACSQLTSFYRSKGCPELASFQTGSAWVENGVDPSSIKDDVVDEVVTNEEPPANDKPKRGRGRPRKQKPEDGLELTEKKSTSNLSTDNAYDHPAERQMDMEFDEFDGLQSKKKRSLDSFEDPETKAAAPSFGSSFKIGECIRRAASQLTGSSSIVKSQNEQVPHKNIAETENGDFDVSSDDAINELSVEKRAKRRRMHRHHSADPKELLSQLCSVAVEPTHGYSFSAMVINYFSDYRNYVVSTTTEANIVEKTTAKKGRKRKVMPSPEVETTDHMQDSYWSGLSLHNHPIHDLRRVSTSTRPRRRRRSLRETYFHAQQNLQHGLLSPKKQIQVIERSIIHVDEKMVDEVKPTALVLSFGRSSALPSETDLVKMFGRYGPLKESEIEVHASSSTVKVVFKKRADAERAFSFAGKFSTFGPSLRSYRLVNMPFFLSSQTNNTEAHSEYHGLEIPGPSESKVPLDAAEADQVDKTDEKVEDKGTAEVLARETGDSITAPGALDEKTEKEATAEALADKTTEGEITAEVQVEETTTTEKIVEDKELAEETTEEGETTAEVHIEETSTTERTVEDKELAEETTEGEATAEVHIEETTTTEKTVEDKVVPEETTEGEATAEVLEECTAIEKIVEDNTIAEEITEGETVAEVHVEVATAIDKAVEENTLAEETAKGETTPEVHVEETTTAVESVGDKAVDETTKGETTAEVYAKESTEKTVEDTTVEAPDEKTKTGNDPVEDATVEEPDKKTAANDPVEDATVEEPDKKTAANDHVEDATPEEPDKNTTTNDHVEDVTVEEPDKKTAANDPVEEVIPEETDKNTTTNDPVEDVTIEEPDMKTEANDPVEEATVEEPAVEAGTIEEIATAEARDEKTMITEETAQDPMVEDEKTMTTEETTQEPMVEDEKTVTTEETVQDPMVVDDKTMTTEKTVQDSMVEEGGTNIAAAEETVEHAAATAEALAGQASSTEQTG
uniref:PWWP domain-containing protein n=1 Tax=Oryza nivara TaxID=4536 RepID=A0A0E0HFN3_ORYNI